MFTSVSASFDNTRFLFVHSHLLFSSRHTCIHYTKPGTRINTRPPNNYVDLLTTKGLFSTLIFVLSLNYVSHIHEGVFSATFLSSQITSLLSLVSPMPGANDATDLTTNPRHSKAPYSVLHTIHQVLPILRPFL